MSLEETLLHLQRKTQNLRKYQVLNDLKVMVGGEIVLDRKDTSYEVKVVIDYKSI